MYSHAPDNYQCPFCRLVAGGEDDWICQDDIVSQDDWTTAFVAPAWWPNNPGHVIVIPNTHHENIYDLPTEMAAHIHASSQRVAIALKHAYGCDGTSTRQHNEPGGDQEVWHYHLHVFPRWHGDQLYGSKRRRVSREARSPYAAKIRSSLADRAQPADRLSPQERPQS